MKCRTTISQASLCDGTHDKSRTTEELDEEKSSRPVLKPSQEGRSSSLRERPAAAAASLAPCLHCPGRQALRAAAGGRDRTPHDRWHTGTRGDAPTPVARRRSDQYSLCGSATRWSKEDRGPRADRTAKSCV